MKAFIWDVPNNNNHSYGVAFAETVESARTLVLEDIKALQIPNQIKIDVMTKVMGEPDEILEPPFGYIEIGCHHGTGQKPGSRFLKTAEMRQLQLSLADIADGIRENPERKK